MFPDHTKISHDNYRFEETQYFDLPQLKLNFPADLIRQDFVKYVDSRISQGDCRRDSTLVDELDVYNFQFERSKFHKFIFRLIRGKFVVLDFHSDLIHRVVSRHRDF